jgi:uncharacterized membrane protein
MLGPSDNMGMDIYTRERVLAKTFVWRIIATLTGAAIAAILSGELETAGWFILIEFPLKMGFYYVHERAWETIEWGVAEPSA